MPPDRVTSASERDFITHAERQEEVIKETARKDADPKDPDLKRMQSNVRKEAEKNQEMADLEMELEDLKIRIEKARARELGQNV